MQVNFLNPTNYTNYAWQNTALTTVWAQYQKTFIAPYTGNLLFTQDFGFQTGTFFVDNYTFGRTSQVLLEATADDRAPFAPTQTDMSAVRVSPNPFAEIFDLNATPGASYMLLDLVGNLVASGQLDAEGNATLALYDKPKGIYLLRVGGIVKKVIKQ